MRFNGKTALVTGGSGGIGSAIVRQLAEEGARVALNYHTGEERAREIAAGLEDAPGEVDPVRLDVTEEAAVREFVSGYADEHGGLDLLVNNAGARFDNLLVRMKTEQWERALDINLSGTYHVCRAALRKMAPRRSGAIVNIASAAGVVGSAGQANYAAAKGGVIAFTKSIAEEYGARGIRANVVVPGIIKTGMTEDLPDERRESFLEQIPLDRFGEPEEVASAVVFLLSDSASYINGASLAVNGGGLRV